MGISKTPDSKGKRFQFMPIIRGMISMDYAQNKYCNI